MTDIDPRTIVANALGYLRKTPGSGWRRLPNGWHHTSGAVVSVDIDGADGDITIRYLGGGSDIYWEDTPWHAAAQAVDSLAARGVLPHRLSTGYQLACQQWADTVAQAQEAKRLAEENVRELAEQLATLDANIAAQMRADANTVRKLQDRIRGLEGQLAAARQPIGYHVTDAGKAALDATEEAAA